jgi:hypothetical protein
MNKFIFLFFSILISNAISAQQISQVGFWNNFVNVGCKYTQNHLIVRTVSAIRFLDVSNPSNPVSISSLANPIPPVSAGATQIEGNYAYFASSQVGGPNGYFSIVDISNFNAPIQLGVITGLTGGIYQIEVMGNYAYFVNRDSLFAVNITNKMAPFIASKLKILTSPNGIAIVGQFAYVTTNNGLKVVDISNPLNMSLVGGTNLMSYGKILSDIPNNRLILGNKNSNFQSFHVFSLSNPVNPVFVYNGGSVSFPEDIEYNNGLLYQTNFKTIRVFQLAATTSNIVDSIVLNNNITTGVSFKDSIFYVSTTDNVLVLKLNLGTSNIVNTKINNNSFSLYPNPVANVLSISQNDLSVLRNLEITNGLGQKIKTIQLSNSIENIDVSDMPSGFYYVSISTDRALNRFKIIKK